MRRTTISLLHIAITIVMMGVSLGANADYTAFTVKENSGTWTSYGLKDLKITFNVSTMTIKNSEQTVSYPISDLSSMLFTDLVASLKQAGESYTVVSLQGSEVKLNVKAGTLARVYDTQGRLCATARVGQQGVPVFIGNLEPGIYVVRAAKQSCKVLVK